MPRVGRITYRKNKNMTEIRTLLDVTRGDGTFDGYDDGYVQDALETLTDISRNMLYAEWCNNGSAPEDEPTEDDILANVMVTHVITYIESEYTSEDMDKITEEEALEYSCG